MAYEANRKLFQSEIDTKNFLAWLDAFDARLVRERWLLLEDTYEIIAKNSAFKVSEVLFYPRRHRGLRFQRLYISILKNAHGITPKRSTNN